MALDDRLNAAQTRINGALSLNGQGSAVFTVAGVPGPSVPVTIDWQPKPDKLITMNFEQGTTGQVVLLFVKKTDMLTPPNTGAKAATATSTFRVIGVFDLGHLWQIAVST